MAQHVSIDTAQNVKLNYKLAGIGPRLLGYIIDWLIKGAYIALLALLIVSLFDKTSLGDESLYIIATLLSLPVILYSFILETLYNGQTPGKWAMKIKVVRVDGTSPTMGNYFMRWLLRIIDLHTFYGLVAIISIAASKKGQRLGDMAAGTTVISMNNRIKLESFSLPEEEKEEYIPIYTEASKLSDNDATIIKQILRNMKRNYNADALQKTALKVKDIIGATDVNQTDIEFLKTIIKDYNYYASLED